MLDESEATLSADDAEDPARVQARLVQWVLAEEPGAPDARED